MKKKISLFLSVLLLSSILAFSAHAKSSPAAYSKPVEAVKGFITSLVTIKNDVAWASLTKKSQDRMISMIADDEKMEPAVVRSLFEKNDKSIQDGFWKSFREASKLSENLPRAKFKLSSSGENEAIVDMTWDDKSISFKAIKEGGFWKMGYVETFPM